MEFYFTVKARMSLSNTKGSGVSKLNSVDLGLEMSPNLQYDKYVSNGELTEEGSKVVTTTLCSALIAQIKNAHHYGLRDDAEHLRFVISELERGFVAQADVEKIQE